MSSEAKREVWFVHWNNGPSQPFRRSGPYYDAEEAQESADGYNQFNAACDATVVRYEPSTPAAKAGDGWIRCSERAPTEHGFYLVHHEEHGYDVFLHNGEAWGKSQFFDFEDPTHWQPLPAPPSPETNGEA